MAKKPTPKASSDATSRARAANARSGPSTSDIKPIGGYFVFPEGYTTYQYDPSEFGAAGALPYGKGNPLIANVGPNEIQGFLNDNPAYGGLTPSRGMSPTGNIFYAEGDEQILAGQIMNKGPEEVARVQQMLEDAGYLKGTYTSGQMDPETVAAFTSALELANYLGTDWEKALTVRKAKMKEKPKKKAEPLVLDLTSPDDIKAMLAAGAQQLFGSYVSKDDLDRFVEKTRGQEAEYQTARRIASGYDVAGNPIGPTDEAGNPVGQPGTVLPSPPTTAAGQNRQFEEQFFAEHPAQAGASVFQTKLGEIISSLHGPNIRIPT